MVGPQQHLGEGQLHVIGDPFDLGKPLGTRLVYERREGVLVQPTSGLRQRDDGRKAALHDRRAEIAEDAWLSEARLASLRQLHSEKPFMDDVAEAVDDTCAVEV